MSSAPETQPAVTIPVPPMPREIRIYSHSALFYWWPVWATGFLMCLLTYIDGHRMALVPPGTRAVDNALVEYAWKGEQKTERPKEVLIVSEGNLPRDKEDNALIQPKLHMAQSKNLGVLFAVVLLLIIVISNVPLHGLWSVIIILFIFLLSVIFALVHVGPDRSVWDWILEKLHYLDIRINAGGYLFIALVLFIIWAITVFIFDHRTYVVITPGQVRVCMAVGAGETAYDATGMTFQKRQDDLFRHWIVGLGSGDLIIHRTNTNQEIDMPNVLFIGAKIKEIEKLMKEREVV